MKFPILALSQKEEIDSKSNFRVKTGEKTMSKRQEIKPMKMADFMQMLEAHPNIWTIAATAFSVDVAEIRQRVIRGEIFYNDFSDRTGLRDD
jgi:xanthine dehydrogenase iron-sulfur cluster and FAD-binding subunit A